MLCRSGPGRPPRPQSARKWASLSAFMSWTSDVAGSRLHPVGVAQHEEDADGQADDQDDQAADEPSLMDMPANPDAMPVANGLMVDPSVPMPQPSRTTAAPVSAS